MWKMRLFKSAANRLKAFCHRVRDAVSRRLRRIYKSSVAALKFLAFMEETPKHSVARNLSPIHAILTFYFCLIAPAILFFWLIPYGFLTAFTGEAALVIATLEIMHIIFDR